MKTEATLHGMKIGSGTEEETPTDRFSKEEEEALDRAAKERMKQGVK